MKTVRFFRGSVAVELGVEDLNWLTSLDMANDISKQLKADNRRILKKLGLWNEFHDESVDIDFSSNRLFIMPCNLNEAECEAYVKEANSRHYKTIS